MAVTELATSAEAVETLLSRTKRSAVPIRRRFLGTPEGPGPLGAFVSGRRGTALNMYLALRAGAAADPWDVELPAMAWARIVGLSETPGAEATISRNWTWLGEQELVRSERHNRLRKVFLLREDGSGQAFERPDGTDRGFFKLPYAYFKQGWHRELKLAARATLLICLAQRPTFQLKTEHVGAFYGVSPDTLQRGLDELRDLELLKVWSLTEKAPLSRTGFTSVNHYALQGPFVRASPEAIDAAAERREEPAAAG